MQWPKHFGNHDYRGYLFLSVFFPQFTGKQGNGKAISLTALYHFHPLQRNLEISQAITVKS